MAMTQSTAHSSIVIGIIELVLGTISVICGIVSMSKLTDPAATTIGIWALYFAIPGILCILAGFKINSSILGISIGMNIIGIILAVVAIAIGALFWSILSLSCVGVAGVGSTFCHCGSSVNTFYQASCPDLMVVKNATGAATIMYALLLIMCFVGSILGCVGTCCAPREPNVIVTHALPTQPGTLIISSASQQTASGYAAQPYYPSPPPVQPSYTGMDPPGYDGQYNPAAVQYPTK